MAAYERVREFDFKDIIYEKRPGVAKISINRPQRMNSLTAETVQELITALTDSWVDRTIGAVILTGTGDKAFCAGGDQSKRKSGGYASESKGLNVIEAHQEIIRLIRGMPKPVIAAVNGYAIGGGHVIHVACDLSVAADTAQFGQVGPKVGSFDAGFGSTYLAHVIGEKRAREVWYLCRRYTAQQAFEMGMVNAVVPAAKLFEETDKICDEVLEKSPLAISLLKKSFNAGTDFIWGIHNQSGFALQLYYSTEEAMEGRNAFMEKRTPDFNKFRKG